MRTFKMIRFTCEVLFYFNLSMRLYFSIYLISLIIIISSCSPPDRNRPLTQKFQTDMSILLPEGKYLADKMSGIEATPHQLELSNKFELAMKLHEGKGPNFLNCDADGFKYSPINGLTESELNELKTFLTVIPKPKIVGQEEIEIEIEDSTIHFYSQGDLDDLNNLWIDLKDSSAHFLEVSMPLYGYVHDSKSQNIDRTPLYGYYWSFEYPPKLARDFTNKQLQENSILCQTRIMRMPRLEKTLIYLYIEDIDENGERKVLDLTVYF